MPILTSQIPAHCRKELAILRTPKGWNLENGNENFLESGAAMFENSVIKII